MIFSGFSFLVIVFFRKVGSKAIIDLRQTKNFFLKLKLFLILSTIPN